MEKKLGPLGVMEENMEGAKTTELDRYDAHSAVRASYHIPEYKIS